MDKKDLFSAEYFSRVGGYTPSPLTHIFFAKKIMEIGHTPFLNGKICLVVFDFPYLLFCLSIISTVNWSTLWRIFSDHHIIRKGMWLLRVIKIYLCWHLTLNWVVIQSKLIPTFFTWWEYDRWEFISYLWWTYMKQNRSDSFNYFNLFNFLNLSILYLTLSGGGTW